MLSLCWPASVFPDVGHLLSLYSSPSGFLLRFSGEPFKSFSYLMWRKGGTGGSLLVLACFIFKRKAAAWKKMGKKYAQAMFFGGSNIGDDVK